MTRILAYSVITMMVLAANIPMDKSWIIFVGAVQAIPLFTLAPRFILSLRELYTRDCGNRLEGDIDTAFGLTSRLGHDTVASTIMFADSGKSWGLEKDEEIPMEECGSDAARCGR